MKIPAQFPQFEKPALFIASGEYEAGFYLANRGMMDKRLSIKMPPREEAKEKQGFVGHKAGMSSLSSVSHRGKYLEDLKKKFQKRVHAAIHDLIARYKLEEIYLFAPSYAIPRIIDGLDGAERKKVRMRFAKEIINQNPLRMLELFWAESQKAVGLPHAERMKEMELL